MAGDWIPSNHDKLKDLLEQFEAWLVTNGAAWGFSAGEITDITTKKNAVVARLATQKAATIAVNAANSDLVTAEDAVKVPWRKYAKRVQDHPNTTDPIRIAAGVPVHDTTPTAHVVGAEVPAVLVLPGVGKLVIHWGTDPSNEQINTKPAWASGANIYISINNGPEQLTGFDPASPFKYIVTGPAASFTVRVAYRATKEDAIGTKSAPVTVSAGG